MSGDATTPATKNKVCLRCSSVREILRATAVEIFDVTICISFADIFTGLAGEATLQPNCVRVKKGSPWTEPPPVIILHVRVSHVYRT